MTLEEFNKIVSDASQKAHLLVSDGLSGAKRVKGVGMRLDDDGVLSLILYTTHLAGRVESDESKQLAEQRRMIKELLDREPCLRECFQDFDGFFVHWNEISGAFECAGDDYRDWGESPLELIGKLISERDELKRQLHEQPKELTQ